MGKFVITSDNLSRIPPRYTRFEDILPFRMTEWIDILFYISMTYHKIAITSLLMH